MPITMVHIINYHTRFDMFSMSMTFFVLFLLLCTDAVREVPGGEGGKRQGQASADAGYSLQ